MIFAKIGGARAFAGEQPRGMKRMALGLVLHAVCTAAYGQGQVVINNRIVPDVNARLISGCDPYPYNYSSIGTDDIVEFFGGKSGTPVSSLQPLDPAFTTMRGAAGTPFSGYFTPVTATVPGVPPGGSADIVLRLVYPLGGYQTLGPYTVTLGGGVVVPPNLPLGTSPLVVDWLCPEPSPNALMFLGIAALALRFWLPTATRIPRSPQAPPTRSAASKRWLFEGGPPPKPGRRNGPRIF